jgi:predicted enzyme related to lactoylglutathione lyase
MSITKLYSADLYVWNQDRAVDFYVNKLGFDKRIDVPADEQGNRWIAVAPPRSDTTLILAHGFGSWSPDKVGGWSRTIFTVDDMANTVEALKAAGVEFDSEPEAAPYGIYAQIRDPDGNILGLLQAPE